MTGWQCLVPASPPTGGPTAKKENERLLKVLLVAYDFKLSLFRRLVLPVAVCGWGSRVRLPSDGDSSFNAYTTVFGKNRSVSPLIV